MKQFILNWMSDHLEMSFFRLLHIIQRVTLVILAYLLTIPVIGISNINLDDKKNEQKGFFILIIEIILNTIIIVCIVFVIKRVVEDIPFIFDKFSKVYSGASFVKAVGYAEVATISLVIFTTQVSTRDKLNAFIKTHFSIE